MAISVFPAVSTSTTNWLRVGAANTNYIDTRAYAPGIYRFRYYADGLQSTVGASVSFTNGTTIVQSHTLVDSDSSDGYNPSELIVELTTACGSVWASASAAGFLSIEFLNVINNSPLPIVKLTSSQSYTLTKSATVVIIGGGGGGGTGWYGPQQSGGGGSGYLASGTIDAGTYSAVIGAGGGGGGGRGGTTTFATLTAEGGYGGQGGGNSGVGGNGGSGGGSGYNGNGYAGGRNGANGSGEYPGTGSGVAQPNWLALPPTNGGRTSAGFYQGGHGAIIYQSGATPVANSGGGGGGGGQDAQPGAAGAAGAVFILSL